jgi:opacity protein-like surface antigen
MHREYKLPSIALIGVATSLAMAGQAQAQTENERKEGFYLSATVGADFLNDSDFVGTQNPDPGVPGVAGAPANVNVGYDTGFAIRGAVGYQLKQGLISFLKPRFELEVGYAESDVSGGSFNGGNQNFGGDLNKLTVTAATYSDIVWSANQKIVPYFGSGIGIGVVDANISYFPNDGVATAPTFGVQGSRTSLVTFNAIGATVKASDKFDIFAEGRYTNVRRRNFDRRFIAGGADGFNALVRDDTESFGVGIGVRAKF